MTECPRLRRRNRVRRNQELPPKPLSSKFTTTSSHIVVKEGNTKQEKHKKDSLEAGRELVFLKKDTKEDLQNIDN